MIKKLKVQNLKCKAVINSFKVLKFYVVVLSFAFLVLSLPASVHAQAPTPTASSLPTATYQLPANVSPTSPIYTDLIVHNMFHTFSCLAVGQSMIGQPCLTYQVQRDAQGVIKSIPVLSQTDTSGGIFGTTLSLITMMYANPPAKTADYIASVEKNLGIVKKANAQVVGSGEKVLNPVLSLWQVSRNISYLIMIIVFTVIGLMVMFRNRINPQTVINAQAALPGLVLGLILITFSYFFAAIISDTAFIGTNVVGYFFAAAQGPTALADPTRTNLVQQISTHSVLDIFSQFVGIITQEKASDALEAVYYSFSGEVQNWLAFIAALTSYQFAAQPGQQIPVIGQFVGPILGLGTGFFTFANPTGVLGLVLSWVAFFALAYQMLQLLLKLLSSYLTIIFLTISAPFHFLAASLPGRQGIANNWFMNLLANILVFPAVIAVFYFAAFLLGESFGPLKISGINPPQQSTTLIPIARAATPTIVSNEGSFPLFGGMSIQFIQILLAFGSLMALPKIPDLVVKSIGKVGQAGQILGQEVSGGIRSGQGYLNQGVKNIQGIGGHFGNFVDEPGYVLEKGGWRKVTASDSLDTISRSGARPGVVSKLKGWFR